MKIYTILLMSTLTSFALADLTNPSFESPALASGVFNTAGISGWTTSGTSGVWNIPFSSFACEAPLGNQIGFCNAVLVAQQSTNVLLVGQNTVSMMVGRRTDGISASTTLELWAGGTVASGTVTGGTKLAEQALSIASIPRTSFKNLTLTYNAAVGDPHLGQLLSVRLVRSTVDGSQMDFDDFRINQAPETTVSGNINLSDFIGNVSAEQLWAKIDNCNYCVNPDAAGNYSFITSSTNPNATITFRGRTWLGKSVTNVNLSANVSNVNASLINGDCDGDNGVDLTDYTIVVTAFNAIPTSANWNLKADLNGDGVVDLTDYVIVTVSFNAVGN